MHLNTLAASIMRFASILVSGLFLSVLYRGARKYYSELFYAVVAAGFFLTLTLA